MFEAAHNALYDRPGLEDLEEATFAVEIGIGDSTAFSRCVGERIPAPAIERDIADAENWDIFGTPTVIVNGLRLGRTPDEARLRELIVAELEP